MPDISRLKLSDGNEYVLNDAKVRAELKTALRSIKKIKPYFYTADVNQSNLDYAWAIKFYEDNFHNKKSVMTQRNFGGCSTARKGNLIGRNFDWFYNHSTTIVVRTQGGNGKFASIGTVSGSFALTEDVLDAREYVEMFKDLPFSLVDGVNEKGVYIADLVVPTGDLGHTTGTHAELPGDYICALMLPRYVLDHFATAAEAVEWLNNKAKIYAPSNGAIEQELHFMLCDKTETYSVEFINNACVTKLLDKPYMTNFYLEGVSYKEDGSVDLDTVTDYGDGLERYALIQKAMAENSDMKDLMRRTLKYTKAYTIDEGPDFWFTEFVGKSETEDLTVHSDRSLFHNRIEKFKQYFADRTRDDGNKTWQSLHSALFDLDKKTLSIVVQEEDMDEYNFSLDEIKASNKVENNLAKAQVELTYVDANVESLVARLDALEVKVSDMRKNNIESIVQEKGSVIVADDASKDFIVSGELDTKSSVTCQSLTLKNLNADMPSGPKNQSAITINALFDVDIKDSELKGNATQAANLIAVDNAEYLTIKNVTFTGDTYNTLMVGQHKEFATNRLPKNILIDNCMFEENCKHINLYLSDLADGAIVTISNCHFAKAEQIICLGAESELNKKLTINLFNCIIDNYEHSEGDEYSGIIYCDSRNLSPFEDFVTAGGFNNTMINIFNVEADGKLLTAENFNMGTKDKDQMLYVYFAKSQKNLNYSEYHDLFPKVTIM